MAHSETTPEPRDSVAFRDAVLRVASLAADRLLEEDRWEDGVDEVLAELGAVSRAHRVYLFENQATGESVRAAIRFEWCAPGVKPGLTCPTWQDFPYEAAGFRRWVDVLSAGEAIVGPCRSFPEDEARLLARVGVRSVLVAPVFASGVWWGFLGFDECERERHWDAAEVDALRVVVGMLGSAIGRRQIEGRLLSVFEAVESAGDAIAIQDREAGFHYHNRAFVERFGYEADELQAAGGPAALFPDGALAEEVLGALRTGASWRGELELLDRDGRRLPAAVRADALRDGRGSVRGHLLVLTDTRDRMAARRLEAGRLEVLERVARRASLEEVFAVLARTVESQLEATALAAARTGHRLRVVAAPGLPPELLATLRENGIPLGQTAPGLAAATGELVVHEDLASAPGWGAWAAPFAELGYRAAWALPVFGADDAVAGTVTLLLRESRRPTATELQLLREVGRLAAVALEHHTLFRELDHRARHDALTGLPNRAVLEERLPTETARARRAEESVALLFVDLDDFKKVNDTLGHHVGDDLLRQVAVRLGLGLRREDTLVRLGGDEFAMLITQVTGPRAAAAVAARIAAAFERPFRLQGHDIHMSASVGVSLFPDDGDDFVTLFKHADAAMYRAKRGGRGSFAFFTADMNDAAQERLELEGRLRTALADGAFELHFQPVVEIEGGRVDAFEALLRWPGGPGPSEFVPLAEETGLIVPLGDWVLREACLRAAGWPGERVAVNVSARQFDRDDFPDAVAAALTASGLEPCRLELEVTESVVMRGVDEVARRLERLRALGVRVAIDDFGTGYSSLAYLQRLPIDALKIDRTFVAAMAGNGGALVRSIVSLARSLRLQVVAEGVETAEQLELLREVGCERAQGFLFGRPTKDPERA